MYGGNMSYYSDISSFVNPFSLEFEKFLRSLSQSPLFRAIVASISISPEQSS